MGVTGDEESATSELPLLPAPAPAPAPAKPPPGDARGLAYAVYLLLGAGFLLPWNAFITAVDYFSFLYPSTPVDRVFAGAYMATCLVSLLLVVATAKLSSARVRINFGLALFMLALVVPPALDASAGSLRARGGFGMTVAAVVLSGVADAVVQGGVVGAAGEMPEIYMQAVFAGTAVSGVLASVMRIITKALYPQDADGLRKSANLYFAVSIAVIVLCLICYNVADRLPIVQYYKDLKRQAILEEGREGPLLGKAWLSSLKEILGKIKWSGFGIFLIYVVTLAIFPGFITEDVNSETLKDWYPILLIASYNIFDLVGKTLPSVYILESLNIAVAGCVARLFFFPLYLGCLHGPAFLRTEAPIILLTCLLGLSNGYLTSILMMHAPKTVPIQQSEMAGIAMVGFLAIGLVTGSIVTWFWVI